MGIKREDLVKAWDEAREALREAYKALNEADEAYDEAYEARNEANKALRDFDKLNKQEGGE